MTIGRAWIDNGRIDAICKPETLGVVLAELEQATCKFGSFKSAHEGYAVLLEEVDELWDEVKKNSKSRSKALMRAEAVQVAAMALRFIEDVCS